MAIITISRQLGSQGSEIAQMLSQQLNYRLLDKENLATELRKHGISDMVKHDEKGPNFYNSFSSKNYTYIHFLQSALFKFAENGRCIILGRGGQCLLGILPGTMKLNITAPDELRQKRIKVRFSCGRPRAKEIMQTSDRERSGFHNFFFNIDWQDASQYDLIMSTEYFSTKKAAGIIIDSLSVFDTDEIHKQSQHMLDNIRLGQEIITNIFENKKIPVRYLRASAEDGIVTLDGGVMSSPDIDVCEHAAMEVPGVRRVINRVNCINSWGGIA
jgi:cytidylate kinase